MFGLAILAAFAAYWFICVAVVKRTKRWARATGRSSTRWGWGAAVAMYLLVFWDWIPFLLVRHYYCEKEAGFFVYQTLEQWKAANPGWKVPAPINYGEQKENHMKDIYYLNARFRLEVAYTSTAFSFLPLERGTKTLIDAEGGAVIARFVTFYGGGNAMLANSWGDYKLWLAYKNCGSTTENLESDFEKFINQFEKLDKEVGHDS